MIMISMVLYDEYSSAFYIMSQGIAAWTKERNLWKTLAKLS